MLYELLVRVMSQFSWPAEAVYPPKCFALERCCVTRAQNSVCHTGTCAFESPANSFAFPFNNDPRAKGCERGSSPLLLSVILSFIQQAAEHETLLRRKSTPWNKNDLGGVASLMALCKSRAFMAFPSTRSQQTSTGCHSSHYTIHPQQETQPDRPIGYGAFGVVW